MYIYLPYDIGLLITKLIFFSNTISIKTIDLFIQISLKLIHNM